MGHELNFDLLAQENRFLLSISSDCPAGNERSIYEYGNNENLTVYEA